MGTFSKIRESVIEAGKRILKYEQYGIKTANESAPFGDDSVPINNQTAIILNTSNIAEPIVLGYINTNQKANPGEKRFYAVDANGNEVTFAYLKSDGTLELNGNMFTAVRFAPLNQAISLKDVSINAELTKIQLAISSLGGTYVRQPVNTNLNNAESPDVKLK